MGNVQHIKTLTKTSNFDAQRFWASTSLWAIAILTEQQICIKKWRWGQCFR